MTTEVSQKSITLATWNIFFDKKYGERVAPQFDRLNNIIQTLGTLGTVDVAGLMEVEKSPMGHHGEIITEKLGYEPGVWQRHSRRNEHIGMFGASVEAVEFLDLGYGKQAAITRLGDVAIATTHLKCPHTREHLREQAAQMEVLLSHMSSESQAVIMGDFNTLASQKPRRMLRAQGFGSVLPLLSQNRTATVPTEHYRHLLSRKERLAIKLAGRLMTVDDIYVKNLNVLEAGTMTGDSDHRLVYARLAQPKTWKTPHLADAGL